MQTVVRGAAQTSGCDGTERCGACWPAPLPGDALKQWRGLLR